MKYRYMQNRDDYSDYASGKIFYGAPGHPSFPVRLASEIFQRCIMLRQNMGETGLCTLYDPCCGGAYLLSTIAYLNWGNINQVIGSDIDENALSFALRNLGLLSLEGLDKRIIEVSEMEAVYGKPSHGEALKSGQTLRKRLFTLLQTHHIRTYLFRADATESTTIIKNLDNMKVDVVITDIPYGRHSEWRFENSSQEISSNPIQSMLESLFSVLSPGAIVAIVASKNYEIPHMRYEQVGRFKIGKRQIVFLRPS